MRIADMPAGRELDLLVAERAMGADPAALRYTAGGQSYITMGEALPEYSISWEAAGALVERMRASVPAYRALRLETAGVGYLAAFYSELHPLTRPGAFAHGETAPLAICRAALAALGITEVDHDQR